MNATIRYATNNDLETLQQLATLTAIYSPVAMDSIWIAEDQASCLGYIACNQTLDEMTLLGIAVAPQARRQGIATALHQLAIEHLQPNYAYLEVRASNHAAQRLYHHLGYRSIGERRDYYPNPDGSRETALVLRWQSKPKE
ncbi:MAG: GNAT family N-acetyltransferase [Cardiobacteriaceae bacterium]|nr:GNAT family N-acetyltransferase [Cardiobacteriaceae bacterium]